MVKVLQSKEAPYETQEPDFARELAGPRLTVTNLRKSFRSPSGEMIEVLRGASLDARAGEALGIMGASGSGKSTLLHLVGGLEDADEGAIKLDDLSIDSAPPATVSQLRNRRIGFIFQFHHLLPDLSAIENVALPLMIGGLGQQDSLQRARMELEHIGLAERVDHPISYLSGGEQQRVAVSRALITEPSVILADEPTGNLDSVIEDEISARLVKYAHERGRILLVATHNERLADMCDRVLLLKDGLLQHSTPGTV
jgi:lipoprotein-releasing system ATP-binding protein